MTATTEAIRKVLESDDMLAMWVEEVKTPSAMPPYFGLKDMGLFDHATFLVILDGADSNQFISYVTEAILDGLADLGLENVTFSAIAYHVVGIVEGTPFLKEEGF